MKPTLFVLAAGMGSRYGGLKQLDGLGPNGETIMDYSIFDAIRGGFGKIVFVIRRDFEQDFRDKVLSKYEGHIPTELVFQAIDDLPEGSTGKYSMVGFRICNTLSENGTVARGVCAKNEAGMLTDVVERTEIMRVDGTICYKDENGEWQPVGEETPVSMNFWGFTPDYFQYSEAQFVDFLKENIDKPKSEFFIPLVVDTLINSGKATCEVLDTTAKWFGVTYAADRPGTVEKIQALVDAGEYPNKLF